MKTMHFITIAVLIIVGTGVFFLIRFKNQNSTQKQFVGVTPYEQTGQQQKLLEISFSPYGPGHSDPPGVGTQITLYQSGEIENQRTSYKQNGSSYTPVTTTTVSNLQAETITKIESIIEQLMSKDCAKQPDNRSIGLDIYWRSQKKTINSPNCDKEIIEITRLLNQ